MKKLSWLTLALVALGACAEEDKEAPPVPALQATRTSTALESVKVWGSAEYAAKLTLTNNGADVTPEGLVADPFTAEFHAEVKLAEGENAISVVATDAAGNASQPATVTVTRVKVAPQRLTLALNTTLLDADRARVEGEVTLGHSEDVKLEGFEVTARATHEDPATAAIEVSAKADAQGRAHLVLAGLKKAGLWTVTAASKDVPELKHAATVLVLGGAPASLDLTLSSTDVAGAPVSGKAIDVPPGSAITATVTMKDEPGNTLKAGFALYTDAPGALVAGDTISGVVRTSPTPYRVVAVAAGSTVSATATFNVVPALGAATRIELALSKTSVRAGEQVAVTPVVYDKYGNALPYAVCPAANPPANCLRLESTPALSATFGSNNLPQGFVGNQTFVAYDLSGVAASGYSFTLKATATGATPVSTTAALEVRPGPGKSFSKLQFTSGCPTGQTTCTAASIEAGQDLTYAYAVADAYGNASPTPVSVFTNAPGARVIDDGMNGVGTIANVVTARSSSYSLNAYIQGVVGASTMSFFVGTAAPATVAFSLSSSLVATGTQVSAIALVRDAYGNALACPANPSSLMTIGASPASNVTAGTLACTNGVFTQTFTFSAEGTFTLTATYATGPVSSSGYVTVVGFDNAPPTIAIQNIAVNGQACPAATPQVCNVRGGDFVTFDAVAADNRSLSEISYGIFFDTTQNQIGRTVLVGAGVTARTVNFYFRVPGGALPETTALTAQAVDGAGNRAQSAEVSITVVPSGRGDGGRTLTVVTAGGILRGPNDVVVDPTGALIVASNTQNGPGLIKVVQGSTGAATSVTAYTTQLLPATPRYLSIDSSGQIYMSYGQQLDRTVNNGATIERLANLASSPQGTFVLPPTTMRAPVVFTAAPVDGDTLVVDSGKTGAVTFEFDMLNNGCVATGATCVKPAAGTGAAAATAFSAAVNAVSASSFRVRALGPSNTAAGLVTLESKFAAERTTANEVLLAKAGAGSGNVTLPANNRLGEGHDEEIWVGTSGSRVMARFPLAGALPFSTSHGLFDNQVDAMLGLAVREFWTGPTDATYDYLQYWIDRNMNQDTVWVSRYRGAGSTTGGTLTSTNGGTLFGISQLTNGNQFNQLYDVALAPGGGCLLITDPGNGRVYAADVSAGTTAPASVVQVASGFINLRGLTVRASDGHAIVTDNVNGNGGVIYDLAPLATPPNGACF